jgi:hypothetical protein
MIIPSPAESLTENRGSAAADTPHRPTSTPSRDAYRTEIELQKGVDPAQWQNIPKYIHPGKKKSLCVSVGGLWRRPGQASRVSHGK